MESLNQRQLNPDNRTQRQDAERMRKVLMSKAREHVRDPKKDAPQKRPKKGKQ